MSVTVTALVLPLLTFFFFFGFRSDPGMNKGVGWFAILRMLVMWRCGHDLPCLDKLSFIAGKITTFLSAVVHLGIGLDA